MSTNEIESKQDVQATPAVTAPRRFGRRGVWGLAIAAVAVVGLSLSVARAEGFGPGPGGFMKKRMEHVLTAANATDAQKAQIHAIWDGLHPQLKPLHQQVSDLRRQIGQAIAAPTIDPAKVEVLRKQSVQTMDRISALITQGMVSSAQVLTPDQRQAVLKQIEEHHGHHGPMGDDAGE